MTKNAAVPTFFSIDLIHRPDGGISILELNRGVDSGFFGYQALYKVDLWEKALENMPFRGNLYFHGPDEYVGRLPKNLQPLDEIGRNNETPVIYPSCLGQLGYLRRAFPKAVVMDGSPSLFAAFKNKVLFHTLFAPHMPDLLPPTKVYSSLDMLGLTEQLERDFGDAAGLVVKTPEDIMGRGVMIIQSQFAAVVASVVRQKGGLHGGLDTGRIAKEDLQRVHEFPAFVVQGLVPSRLVTFEGKPHHAAVRIAVLALPNDTGGLDMHYLGGYGKPCKAPEEKLTRLLFEDRYKSCVLVAGYDNPRSCPLDDADFDAITRQLEAGFKPALERVMAVPSSDLLLGLLRSDDPGARHAALFPILDKAYFDDSGSFATHKEAVNAARDFLCRDPAALHFAALRLLQDKNAQTPDAFGGMMERVIDARLQVRSTNEFRIKISNVKSSVTQPVTLNNARRRTHLSAFDAFVLSATPSEPAATFEPRPFTNKGDLLCADDENSTVLKGVKAWQKLGKNIPGF